MIINPPNGFTVTASQADDADGVADLDGCTFVPNQTGSFYIWGDDNAEIFTNCSVYHNYDAQGHGGVQALLRSSRLDNTHFYENLPGPEQFSIINTETCIGPNVIVDGPNCKWGNWSTGITGTIPPDGCP